MADPKYVIAMGACAISGGPFFLQYIFCGKRSGSYYPGRCIHTRLPTKARSIAACTDQPSGKNKNGYDEGTDQRGIKRIE